jgi:hypothetical protein
LFHRRYPFERPVMHVEQAQISSTLSENGVILA